MEKTKQLLESVAENYVVAAENICKYIEDPDEKKQQLNDLRELTMEHAKLAHDFDLQEKAVSHVTHQLKEIKDLEIEQVVIPFFMHIVILSKLDSQDTYMYITFE